jgi:hypothetical protein
MKLITKLIAAVVLVLSVTSLSFAHEGHDDAPGALKANHGGIVKAGKEINLEYVISGNDVVLYPISHDGKELTTEEVKLSGTAKSPKGKAEALKIDSQSGAFKTSVDFKGAYRTEVNLTADVKGGKDNFKFQVEKQ